MRYAWGIEPRLAVFLRAAWFVPLVAVACDRPGVTGTSVPVALVTVTPSSASVSVGQTVYLMATPRDANGDPLSGRAVGWTSSDGTIATVNGSGLVSAVGVGSATIAATSERQSGTAAITVSALPPPASGGWPDEPVGLTVLTDWAEDAVVGGGWGNAYPVSLAKGYVSIVRDGTARWSPPNVLHFFYPIGFPTGVAPATVYYDMAATKELYAVFWWKASNPWQDNAAGNKIAFMFAQSGDGQMFIMMNGVGAPRHLVVTTEFPGDNRNLWPNVSNPDVTLGVWHRIEWSAKYSTTGSSRDGIVQWWLDGVRVGSYTDVQLPGDAGFLDFQFSPTFGGTGPVKTENDYYWVDHVHLSRR